MRLNEILNEDQNLQEGPLLNKIGTAVGKTVGGVAKAAGAVAGGIAGIGDAAKKGFQAGKATVAGAGDQPAAPRGTATTTAPAAGQATPASSQGSVSAPAAAPAAAPSGLPKSNTAFGRLAQAAAGQDPDAPAQPAAQPTQSSAQTPTAAPTAAQPAQTPAAAQENPKAANDTEYAKAQKAIATLQPEQQKELLAALMSDAKVKAALDAAAAKKNPQQQQAQPPAAPATGNDATAPQPSAAQKAGRPTPVTAPAAKTIDDNTNIVRGGESMVNKNPKLAEGLSSHIQTVQAMNRGFQRGLANPFAGPGGGDSGVGSKEVSSDIVDKSGTMPVQLIQRVNSLDSTGKTQLFKFLKARQ